MAELDIRVEDFLDDKLQSATDFEELDNLLSNIETQRAQLQSQLDSAAAELETARQTSVERQTSLDRQIADFKKLQQSIDVRMRIISTSDAPDEAIRRLEQPMKQLHKVDLAVKYLELLQDVEQLTKETRACLPGDPRAALEPYTQLRRLAGKLKELQGPADEAASHLVAHVTGTADALWAEMKRTMWKEMDAVLTAHKWRNEPDAMEEADEEWLTCFEKLIDLQVPEVLYSEQVITLFPIDVMAHVFVKEFNFHFMGKNQTSSLQSLGTHCFAWFLSLIENWEDFFRVNFGYILASRFQSTFAKHGTVYLDPACALVTSMLPAMREKIQSIEAEALLSPKTLSSVVSQLLAFDDEIRNRFSYDGGDPEKGWAGLASEFLHRNFDAWLRAEKDFALERFREILAAPDARNIDYDFAVQGKNKPTFGAVRVMDLLQSVTAQYQRVRRFSHKLRFLIDIQLTILDEYHDRLRGSLEAYYSMTSTVGRTLHGATKEQLAALEGTGALETLCKVYGSADHVVETLRDWGNEEYFITLWEQLNSRSEKHEDPNNFAGAMSFDEVKGRTSTSVGSDEDGGILFDETIAAYSQRRKAAQDFLVGALVDSHQKAFRPYLTRVQWQTVNESTSVDPSQLEITAELEEPLHVLRREFDFLSRALGTAAYRRTWRTALEKLSDMLWGDVLLKQHFTTYGAGQFARDVQAICSLIDGRLADGSAALQGLVEGVRLLNLPVELEEDEEEQDGANGNETTGAGRRMTLKQASDRVYKDNAEAKAVLEELDIVTLTPTNARAILHQRVEE